jgi:hypothetical protein
MDLGVPPPKEAAMNTNAVESVTTRRGTRRASFVCAMIVAGVAPCWLPTARACDQAGAGTALEASAAPDQAAPGGPAMRAHIDPATGKLGAPPAGESNAAAPVVAPAAAGAPRQEPLPGGGFKVDTRYRVLQSAEGSN